MGTMSGNTAAAQDREVNLSDLRGKSAKEIAELALKAGQVPLDDLPSSLRK
jgi:hypothetical protein